MEGRVVSRLTESGCPPAEASLACRVFVELSEVKAMRDVEAMFCGRLKLAVVKARARRGGRLATFVPRSSASPVSMRFVQGAQEVLAPKGEGIALACVDADSTVALYAFTEGLIAPANPDSFAGRKTREERRDCLEAEIKKNRDSLLLAAYRQSVVDE